MSESLSLARAEPRDDPTENQSSGISLGPHKHEDARAEKNWEQFSESNVSFAIDHSGSTSGPILACEQQAIRSISSLLSDTARSAAKVLPWNSGAGQVTDLSGLSEIKSHGGTDPGALLRDISCSAALRSSSLWLLLTDGQISDNYKQRFANELSSLGLHGTACVVIIFGDKRRQPTDCNISVGVSVFAAAPDCLFLFMDTKSDICYLLQSKGTFTKILEQRNQKQPVLNDNTKWQDLPQISLEDLSYVQIPEPLKLQPNEVFFERGLIVNLTDLFADDITDEKIINAILGSRAHMRTLTMTAETRGMAEQLREWAVKQELDPSELLAPDIPEVDQQVIVATEKLMQRLDRQRDLGLDEKAVRALQLQLREANSTYSSSLNTAWSAVEATASLRKTTVTSIVKTSRLSTSKASSLSAMTSLSASVEVVNDRISASGLSIPTDSGSTFEGTCPLCAQSKTTLALLLREVSDTEAALGLPDKGSKSKVAYPLAMGNCLGADIISSSLYCDACTTNIVQAGIKSGEVKFACALPLVPYSDNEKAYSRQLGKAFQSRFDEADAPLVFLAVLCTTLQRIESEGQGDRKILVRALQWACQNIVQSSQRPDPSVSLQGSNPSELKPLSEVLIKSTEEAIRSTSTSHFQDPIEGFVVMARLLNEIPSKRSQTQKIIKKAAFQRLLFHITEQFYMQVQTHGDATLRLKMARLLTLPEDEKPKAPASQKKRQSYSISSFMNLFRDSQMSGHRISIGFKNLVAEGLLDEDFLASFKKLGSVSNWIETQCDNAIAIFLNYLYRYKADTWKIAETHFLGLAKTSSLAPVFWEPSEINASKAERMIEKLPSFGESDGGKTKA